MTWLLSGKEHGGTGDGTAVTERAARARDPYGLRALMARPTPQPTLAQLMAQQQPSPPFGMTGGFGNPFGGNPFAGVDFGGGPMGGFPLPPNPYIAMLLELQRKQQLP